MGVTSLHLYAPLGRARPGAPMADSYGAPGWRDRRRHVGAVSRIPANDVSSRKSDKVSPVAGQVKVFALERCVERSDSNKAIRLAEKTFIELVG